MKTVYLYRLLGLRDDLHRPIVERSVVVSERYTWENFISGVAVDTGNVVVTLSSKTA